jgi:diguanylate cyclase (GGDEF)-like protein
MTLGGIAIASSVFLGPTTSPMPFEVLGQLLLIGVLFGALHWGRDGGFIAAVIATLIYVMVRIPMLTSEGLSSEMVTLIAVRALAYGVVGIVGGEVSGRIKYIFASMGGSPLIDELTHVYNARHAGQTVRRGLGQYQRYGTPYSAVCVRIVASLTEGFRPARQRAILRSVASHLRNDIRMVDDVAYVGGNEFVLLLPHTGMGGALVAADRVRLGLLDLLGAKEDSVAVEIVSAPEDAGALAELAERFDPKELDSEPSRVGVPASTRQES